MSLPTTVNLIGLVVFLFVVVPYVLGPIIVYFSLRFRVPAEVIAFNPRVEPLPEEIRPHFFEAHEQLTQDGFQLVEAMILPSLVPNVKSILAMYLNRSVNDHALTTFIVAAGAELTMKTRYVEFMTKYSDGVVVQTNNSRELSSFPPQPDEYTFQFWDIADCRRLYQNHVRLKESQRRTGQPVVPMDTEYSGNAVAYMGRGVLDKSFGHQVATGYLRPVPEGLAPSVKGAIIMTWKELWPWKGIRRAQRRRASDQALATTRSRDSGTTS